MTPKASSEGHGPSREGAFARGLASFCLVLALHGIFAGSASPAGTGAVSPAQATEPSGRQQDASRARYQVLISRPDDAKVSPPKLRIEARFPGGVTALSFPGPSVGIEPADWIERWVGELQLHDSAGRAVELRPDGPASWTVAAGVRGELVLSYSVDLGFALSAWPAGNEHAAYWEGDALYAVGEALFATAKGTRSAAVTFSLPEGWRVSTPWPETASGEPTFAVDSTAALLDNAVVLGRHASVTEESRGFRYELALMGSAARARGEASTIARAVLDAYVRLFGGAPDGAYLQVMFVSDAEDGEAFLSSSGFRTSLVPGEENVLLWGNQLAHELFHRWMASDGPIAAASYGDGQWLSEGLAEYYANLTLLRVGAISVDDWLRKLEKHVGLYLYYRASPAFDTSLRAAGANKGRERLAVYNGGWTASFCLDVQTRSASEGEVGLDGFLRRLWDRFGRSRTPYRFEDLPRTFQQATGVDVTDTFVRFIDGTETLPVESCLRDVGLEAGIKGYAGEVWVWPADTATPRERARWNALIGVSR